MTLLEIARIAEPIELEVQEAIWKALPSSLAEGRRMKLLHVGSALISILPRSKALHRNRVLGLGIRGRAKPEMIDAIVSQFQFHHVSRFSFHVSPSHQSEEITDWLKARGFQYHHAYVKLFRNTKQAESKPTDVQVRQVTKTQANQFVKIFGNVFAWPLAMHEWIASTVGEPGFTHFLGYIGARPVASGMVYVKGSAAWMGWAGTLPAFRRRGAHAALVTARVRRAAEMGAKWIVCETLEPLPGRPAGSSRNLLRLGFKAAYTRPIWVQEKQ